MRTILRNADASRYRCAGCGAPAVQVDCSTFTRPGGSRGVAFYGACREHAHSDRRWVILGGPGGYLTVVEANHPQIRDRYRRWQELGRVNVPRRLREHYAARPYLFAGPAKSWALRAWELS